MDKPKICKQCEYASFTLICKHPKSIFDIDLTDGHTEYRSCEDMRRNNYPATWTCGKEGKYFKQKESWLYKLLKKD